MKRMPEQIDIDSIDQLCDEVVLANIDYLVIAGEIYRVVTNDYSGEQYLQRVDDIPDMYWDRWDDEN